MGLFRKTQETSMSTISRSFSGAAIVTGLVLASAGTFFTASIEPAAALCKPGGPHCRPVQWTPPSVGGQAIPGSGWVDPDCKYYGNCDSSEVKGTDIRRSHSGPVNHRPVQKFASRVVRHHAR
jgi:hypothetical protein